MILWPIVGLALAGNVPNGPKVERLSPFTYADVRLTAGPLADQAAKARDFYFNLNEDSLLKDFRLRSGLAAPGKAMGGWYDPDGFAAGNPFGHFIMALARMYANTGNQRYKQKVFRLVHGFHQTLGKDGFFFASQKIYREWPCYIYDKYSAAMREAFQLTGDREALTVLARMTDWAFANLPRRSDEWYTLPENLYKCYSLTGDRRYLIMAGEYDPSREYSDEFAKGKNAFHTDYHAYSHVNSLCSVAMAYQVTGASSYLQSLTNAFKFLTSTQMYASGGWGPDERFVLPGHLHESLTNTSDAFETPCGSYANVNFDRYLIRFTGQAKYGDNVERLLYNSMLACLPPQPDGHTFYYSDYRPGTHKILRSDQWTCCSGTYATATADYPLDIYFHDIRGVYVNLFVPSTVSWLYGRQRIGLTQTTSFPYENRTQLHVSTSKPSRFRVAFRIPYWVNGQVRLTIAGRPVRTVVERGFLVVDRTWKNGDTIRAEFPMSLHFEPIDSSTPDRAALMYGPIMLVALASSDVELAGDRRHPERWISNVPGTKLDFLTKSGVVFRPFFRVVGERYTTYPKLVSPS